MWGCSFHNTPISQKDKDHTDFSDMCNRGPSVNRALFSKEI